MELEIRQGKISLKADDMDLKEILHAISAETGMEVYFNPPETTDLITCRINDKNLTIFLSKLLRNWNYTLMYRESQNTASGPAFLWLVGKVPEIPDSTESESSGEYSEMDNSAIQ